MSFFSKLSTTLFPINRDEYSKFFPMAGMIFAILFNYTILRNMKDTLIVNASDAGLITFLKLYCVTPAAILFITLYIKLTSIFKRETIFYIIVLFFISFFFIFGTVIYPNIHIFHPSVESIENLSLNYPRFQGFIDIYAYWSFSLFYILAELWGSIAVQILFWQFANQVFKMEESKRFYPLFTSLGNMSLIACGILALYLSSNVDKIISFLNLNQNTDPWSISLKLQMILVSSMGILAMIFYRYLNTVSLKDTLAAIDSSENAKKKKKPGLLESFKMIASSKHLIFISLLVIAYGITINLVEVQWKSQMKIYFEGNKQGFNAFMNQYSMWTGVSIIIFSWFVGSGILKKLSWFSAAVITPAITLILGSLFFICIFFRSYVTSLGFNSVMVASFLGASIVIITKVVKYSLFDSTKEMAYIPLDQDLKTKGKPAVEVIGGRFGKAGGALTQNILLLSLGTKNVLDIVSPVFLIFIIIGILWIYAVKKLSIEIINIENQQKS